MATVMKTAQRELRGYISEVSERADVQAGVNFAIFSRDASRVRLELFDHAEDAVPARLVDLDSARNRSGDVWHVWVEGIRPGQLYAYRVDAMLLALGTNFRSWQWVLTEANEKGYPDRDVETR